MNKVASVHPTRHCEVRSNLFWTIKRYHMVMQRGGCVYIMTNKQNAVFYTGVSSDLIGRVWDHKNKTYPKSFTSKYNCDKLVYYYFYSHIEEAISAEKLIKGGGRQSKMDLVNSFNPTWKDLYEDLLNE